MISHHPSREMLMAYALGHVPEAISLIVATHAALCPECREVVTLGESLGGVLLENLPPSSLPGTFFEGLARLETVRQIPPAEPPKSDSGMKAPEPLRTYLHGDFNQVGWIPITPALSYRPLVVDSCRARVLRSRPGTGIGMHTHKGEEYTLVLAGGYTDSSGSYRRGDFQSADRNVMHRPIVDEGEDCIILGVTDAPLIFANPIVGLVAKLMGF